MDEISEFLTEFDKNGKDFGTEALRKSIERPQGSAVSARNARNGVHHCLDF